MLKLHSVMPLLTDERRLGAAARASMRRCSAPGADGVTWKAYRSELRNNIARVSAQLKTGEWRPSDVRLKEIVEFSGKRFSIAIPTVEDRIVHRALRRSAEVHLERSAFQSFVSGSRPGRNRLTSLRQAEVYRREGRVYVADVDVKDVSSGVTVDEVIDWLAEWISDGTFLRIVRMVLEELPTPMARGSGLSPMLINLRLVPIDRAMSERNVVRFGDNYCVFCDTHDGAQAEFELLRDELHRCGMAIAAEKSMVREIWNVEDLFLIAG